MWFNNFPWVYSDEDKDWLYITPEIEVSTYESSKWQRQDSSYISNMGWVWVNKYPFVYSNKEADWLYIAPKNSETLYAFSTWNNKWQEFESYLSAWDEQYAGWIQNPEPYGGTEVLQQIKEAKDNQSKELNLYNKNITDAAPLKFLTNLEKLSIDSNNISDISFLSNLKNLTYLEIDQNQISDISVLSELPNLTNLWISQNKILDF